MVVLTSDCAAIPWYNKVLWKKRSMHKGSLEKAERCTAFFGIQHAQQPGLHC